MSKSGKITRVDATESGTTYTVDGHTFSFASPPESNIEKWFIKAWEQGKDVEVTYDGAEPNIALGISIV